MEGEQPYLGHFLTMVLKHLLSGMITEGTTLGSGPLLVTMLLEAAREGKKNPWKTTPGSVDFQQNSLLKTNMEPGHVPL